jgi:uncharacterized protein (UPF0332 family)
MDWQVYLAKARSNLRMAEMACDAGKYDPTVSSACYAVFHTEITALLNLTDFRPPRWDHDRVQAEFNHRLIHARKVFSTALCFIHWRRSRWQTSTFQ